MSAARQAIFRGEPEHNRSSNPLYAPLFDETHAAKIWRVAKAFLAQDNELKNFPEYLPEGSTVYMTKPYTFWTCSFLPGSLLALLERSVKFPKSLPIPRPLRPEFPAQLLSLCQSWCEPLRQNALRSNTHDLGFMTQPLRMDWELTGNLNSLESVKKAAYNLASRFNECTGAIRSWNVAKSRSYNITDMQDNFLVIVDSMANLDLLYYVGNHTGDRELIEKASSHARAGKRTLVRADYSTYHVVNLTPATGEIQHRFTHQGYNDDSCWSRGQAWALLGFTQTYSWTKDPTFLETAISIADYFVRQLSESTLQHPFVPPWDFQAPLEDGDVVRDTSAGMIAANGLLLLHQILQAQSPYLDVVNRIIEDTLSFSLSSEETTGFESSDLEFASSDRPHTSILKHSTANNNKNATTRYADHGYIVAEFYFLELGNKLLRMGYF